MPISSELRRLLPVRGKKKMVPNVPAMAKDVAIKTKDVRCSRCKGRVHFEDERIVEFISKKRTPTVLRYRCNGDGTHVVYEKGQGWLV